MVRLVVLLVALAGCSGDELHVTATVEMTLIGDDLAATDVEIRAGAWARFDDGVHGYTDVPEESLNIRMKLDDEVVRVPETTGTDAYESAPQKGFPSAMTLLVEDARLRLEQSEPFTVASAPIADGFRLTFSPPQAARELVTAEFSTTWDPDVEARSGGEGSSYVDVPADATNVTMVRRMRTTNGEDTDIILIANVFVLRELEL